MKKIWNTIKYGSGKAKAIVLGALLCMLGVIACFACLFIWREMLFLFGAIVCAFVGMSLFQTLGIREEELAGRNASEPGVSKSDASKSDASKSDASEPDVSGEKLTGKKRRARETGLQSGMDEPAESGQSWEMQDSAEYGQSQEMQDTEEMMSDSASRMQDNMEEPGTAETTGKEIKNKNKKKKDKKKKSRTSKVKREKQTSVTEEADVGNDTKGTVAVDASEKVAEAASATPEVATASEKLTKSDETEKLSESIASPEQDNSQVQVVKPLTDETIVHYDKKKIRKTMHRYKVRRDHRLILIDRSEKLHISQTPAYMWVEGKELHLLLIEQEPRHITIPRYQFSEITYLKKQMVNEDMDYAAFKGKSMLAELFRPYLPDYTHSTVVDDLSAYKNLYGIGDIYVTNRSAKALFDLLGLEFEVNDRVTMSNKVNLFFKDAYKANILLRDNVIDANGYADRISNTLDGLAHSSVSYAEFKDTLNLMIRNKLITQEFAMYYMGVRDNLTK